MLSFLDWWATDASFGFQRIILGQNPDGSGDPLGGDVDGGVFFKLLGRPENQIGHGGTGPNGSLTLASTSDGTKGKIYFGNNLSSAFDEANGRLGVGTASPTAALHVRGSSLNDLTLRPTGSSTDPTTPWVGNDGGTVLGSYIDEVTADDNDYIKVSLDPSNGSIGQVSARIALPVPPSTPSASNTHTLRVRYRRTGTGGGGAPTGPGLDVAIYKGGIVVTGTWVSIAEPAPAAFATTTVTLTGAQITGLGDYTGLEVWCNWTGSRTGCSADSEMQISWIELDCGTATSMTDLAAIDDGGVGILPSWTWNTGLISVLPTLSTDTQDSVTRLQLKTTDAINVFSVKGDGTTEINVAQNTYVASNPIALTLRMDQSVTPNNPMFRVRTNSANVFTVAYTGAAAIDVSSNVVALAVDGGTSADIQRWTKASATQSYIDTNGAFNGPIIGTGLSTFDHITIQNSTATDVLLNMLPLATQSANVITVRDVTNAYNLFSVAPSSTVTVCETTGTGDAVRFQVRVPTTQASANIVQVIRAFAGGNYTAWSMGFSGANVFGDSGANGAGVTKLQLRQGTGQSVDIFNVLSSGSVSKITIDKDMQTTFKTATSIIPDSDVVPLAITNFTGSLVNIAEVTDVDLGLAFAITGSSGLTTLNAGVHAATAVRIWPGGIVGATPVHNILSNSSGSRTFTMPDATGTALVRVGNADRLGISTSIASTSLVASANAPAGVWQVNCWVYCTTPVAGSSVIVYLNYTEFLATLTVTSNGAANSVLTRASGNFTTDGYAVGDAVTGTGVPGGTTITVVGTTTVTVSALVTTGSLSATFTRAYSVAAGNALQLTNVSLAATGGHSNATSAFRVAGAVQISYQTVLTGTGKYNLYLRASAV